MALRGVQELLAALVLFWAMGAGAEASTVYTYSFTQDFTYSINGGQAVPTTLTGSFTGTADAIDHISLDTLSDFHLNFDTEHEYGSGIVAGTYSGLPDYFSFLIGDASGSSLAFQSPLHQPFFPVGTSTACVGLVVAALCDGGTARGVVIAALGGTPVVFASSAVAPVVTLVSAVSSPPVATTPLPGALLLFSTALGGLGVAGVRRGLSA
jgi:hypothetical protein